MNKPSQDQLHHIDVKHSGDRKAVLIAVRHLQNIPVQTDLPGVFWLNGFKSVMTATKANALFHWAQREERSFLRFDFGGHGESSGEFEDGTIGRWLDEAVAVFREYAQGPQILVGSSMGGWIALLLHRLLQGARSENDPAVAGIVLIAPAVDMTRRLIWDQLPQNVREELSRTGKFSRPSQYDEEPYVFTKNLIDEGNHHLLMDNPPSLDCPVRILHGMQDPDVPWRLSLELVEALQCSDVVLTLIKDGDHRLSRDQDIARLIATIEAL